MMGDEPMYDEWIASRKAAGPSRDLTDRIMAAVENRGVDSQRRVRLAVQMDESRPARLAACLAAVLVGCLPFLLVAYVAKLLVF